MNLFRCGAKAATTAHRGSGNVQPFIGATVRNVAVIGLSARANYGGDQQYEVRCALA
ncbi:MAG TPA: hypothetical protein VK530_13055 [Candidatus Acidoferrum sp.]|nr:hypothetical protein [Candidatus Acidoferrum sp.]